MTRELREVLRDFRNAHRDESVIVCGCGESLNTLELAGRSSRLA